MATLSWRRRRMLRSALLWLTVGTFAAVFLWACRDDARNGRSFFYIQTSSHDEDVIAYLESTINKALFVLLDELLLELPLSPNDQDHESPSESTQLEGFLQCRDQNRKGELNPSLCLERMYGDFSYLDGTYPIPVDLCATLASKTILLVGPETTYHLHVLLLEALRSSEDGESPEACSVPLFCTFHHVCKADRGAHDAAEISRYVPPPTTAELKATGSALLRYVISSALYPPHAREDDERYNVPYVNPLTGVREHESYWIKKAKKADIVVFNRGPLPAPRWTYDGSKQGNWSFTDELTSSAASDGEGDLACLVKIDRREAMKSKIVKAALMATFSVFLPEVMDTLRSLRHGYGPLLAHNEHRIAWHGSWYITDDVDFDHLDLRAATHWALYYNTQVYAHNRLLPAILPFYNVTYVPMSLPSARQSRGSPAFTDASRSESRKGKAFAGLLHPYGTAQGVKLLGRFALGLGLR